MTRRVSGQVAPPMRDEVHAAASARQNQRDAHVALDARDGIGMAAVGLLFLVMLGLTWNRWADPVIDHARELNVPVRLLAGEWLYRDVYWYYGPAAPYLNAALYAIFGARSGVLHGSGMVGASLILTLVYWIARQMLSVTNAALTTGLVLVLCALPPVPGNYIQPYTYAALYGLACALLSLVCSVRHLSAPSGRWLLASGICGGAALVFKPELGAVATVPGLVAWASTCIGERRWSWRPLWHLCAPVILTAGAVYGTVLWMVPWDLVVTQTYESHASPEMVYFMQFVAGWHLGMEAVWAIVKASGLCLIACGASAAYALIRDRGLSSALRIRWIVAAVGAGGLLAVLGTPAVDAPVDIQPLRAAPVVLGATIGWSVWRVLACWTRRKAAPHITRVILVVAVFAFMAIARVILNASLVTPYSGFTLPVSIVVFAYLLVEAWPSVFPPAIRPRVAGLGTVLVAFSMLAVAIIDVLMIRTTRDTPIQTARGTLLTDRRRAQAFTKAIEFVRSNTEPGEMVVSFPEATLINFLANRPYPLGDEIVVPGYLTPRKEQEIVRRLEKLNVRVIMLDNRLTREYLRVGFGVGFGRDMMAWIDKHYRPVATFDETAEGRADLPFGSPQFFIRAYERLPETHSDDASTSSR